MELKKMGADAEPALRRALRKAGTGAEVQARVKAILSAPPQPVSAKGKLDLQAVRAVVALHRATGRVARKALRRIAEGRPTARVTQLAKAAYDDLVRRNHRERGNQP